jgi:membrane protein DedA with SNARE-associated domain
LSNETLFLLSYSEPFIYAGIFLILLLCGLGLPIPEELTLLTGGFFVSLGIIRFYPTLAIGFLGILGGDLAIYAIGKTWGRQFFRDHGNKTVFIARFISGLRVAAFFAAGTMGIKLSKFLLHDFLGALILIPLLILLGYYFGASIFWLAEIIHRIDVLLKILAVLACIGALVFYLWLRRRPSGNK